MTGGGQPSFLKLQKVSSLVFITCGISLLFAFTVPTRIMPQFCSRSIANKSQLTIAKLNKLTCIITDERISVLKWSRADLNTDGYVYFYRNKRSYENYQHPSFHGRVKLRDPEMKDGDVSLILKNVTFNDAGIYECHIAVRNPVRSKRVHTEISHFINLTVTGEFVTHKKTTLSHLQFIFRGEKIEKEKALNKLSEEKSNTTLPVV
uniref:Ig-like domain-containing protein n=1 Tax=Neolamprologus brichardi TaxID=32507 RepID=A0A3Q4GUK3_NEOBR